MTRIQMTLVMGISLLFASFVVIYAGSDGVDFVPTPTIDRESNDSITISWNASEEDIGYYYSYEVTLTEIGKETEPPYSEITTNTFTIRTLEPGTNYRFKVRVCVINYTTQCGDWSTEVEGQTRTNQESR